LILRGDLKKESRGVKSLRAFCLALLEPREKHKRIIQDRIAQGLPGSLNFG